MHHTNRYGIMSDCFFGGVPEWPKGTDCKSVGSAFEGSNPSPSTIEKVVGLAGIVYWYYLGLPSQ